MNTRALDLREEHEPDEGEMLDRNRPGKYLPGLVLLLLIVGLLGYGASRLLNEQTLPIRHVRVEGDFQHLSTTALQERATEVVRGGFFNVNVETIQRVLLEEPWIREVSVKRVWPDSITVTIQEQVAVARWNDTAMLNADGGLFAPDPGTFPAGLPRLSGPGGAYAQVLRFYRRLQGILPAAWRISELNLSDRRAWQVGFAGGPAVYLGRRDIDRRTRRLVDYVPASLEEFQGSVESVDMRYTNGFAVQWKPENKPDF